MDEEEEERRRMTLKRGGEGTESSLFSNPPCSLVEGEERSLESSLRTEASDSSPLEGVSVSSMSAIILVIKGLILNN